MMLDASRLEEAHYMKFWNISEIERLMIEKRGYFSYNSNFYHNPFYLPFLGIVRNKINYVQ